MNRAGKTAVRAALAIRTAALFDRLSEHFEHVPAELGHLVEEQHAVVRQADLARPRVLPAADERHIRDRVVWRSKRPLGQQTRARRQESGHGVDRRRFERLVEGQRRQDGRDAPRHPAALAANRFAGKAAGWRGALRPSCRR